MATLVDLIGEGVISGKIAKDLLVMLTGDDREEEPRALVAARGLRQVTDAGVIGRAVDAVIAANTRIRPNRRNRSPGCWAGSLVR